MDPVLAAAARALSTFDPLAALKRIALRDDADALALRGVAMAQLGDYRVARQLLVRAGRGFAGPLARARCLAARGEIALAARDLGEAEEVLADAERELDRLGDGDNALFVRLQRIRGRLLVGAVDEAAAMMDRLELQGSPPRLRALAGLVAADLAVRRLAAGQARTHLAAARRAGQAAAIPALSEEIERALAELDAPVARAVSAGVERSVTLAEVEALETSPDLIVDVCRRQLRAGRTTVSLLTRPVLLALAAALAAAFPGEATREALLDAAFAARRSSDSLRARLRVEIGRLRVVVKPLAAIEASARGFVLRPRARRVVVLLPPAPGEASALLALLRGGESWSTSALARALGTSQRSVQRALLALRDAGRVEAVGRARAQRWVARPPEGFATTLLLVVRGDHEEG
jgi:hypothetical protein